MSVPCPYKSYKEKHCTNKNNDHCGCCSKCRYTPTLCVCGKPCFTYAISNTRIGFFKPCHAGVCIFCDMCITNNGVCSCPINPRRRRKKYRMQRRGLRQRFYPQRYQTPRGEGSGQRFHCF